MNTETITPEQATIAAQNVEEIEKNLGKSIPSGLLDITLYCDRLISQEEAITVANNLRVTMDELIKCGLNPYTRFEDNNSNLKYSWENNEALYNKCHELVSNNHQPKEMIYVYGESGCGKTTILQCLGNLAMSLNKPNLQYITAENFLNELIDAIKNGSVYEFRKKYRTLDFLIIDDLQFMCRKTSTMEELANTINDLVTVGAQIVISADRALDELEISEVLRSKLSFATQMEMK